MGMNSTPTKSVSFTHTSYKAAKAELKTRKANAGVCTWDAGNGFTAEAYFCGWRKREIHTTITPEGFRIN